jgi:beta-lactamase regulating signal transducer with metallopeptidase domain/protocatechuate 3,4-dioxygenase beta subunit
MNWQIFTAGPLAPAQYAMTWFVQSTVLLTMGLLAGRALRKAGPAVQSAIYRTTLVAVLVCPAASFALSWAGVPGLLVRLPASNTQQRLTQQAPRAIATHTPSQTPAATPLPATNMPAPSRTIAHTAATATPPSAEASAPALKEPRQSPVIAKPVRSIAGLPSWQVLGARSMVAASIVWLFGSIYLGLRLLIGQRGMTRLRDEAVPAEPEAWSLCHQVAEDMNLDAPEVRRSPFLASPCLDGIRRPAILLPDDAEDNLRDTFVHELAHLARRDGLWNLLRLGATALFWMQPLLWVLSRRLETTAEEVCDDHVVHFGADRARYAGLLLELAEKRMLPLMPTGVGMISLRSMLARRVTRILDSSRVLSTRASRRALTATLVFGLIGTTLAGLLGVSGATPKANGDEPKAGAKTKAEAARRTGSEPRTLRGKVLDPDGKPAEGAVVIVERFRASATSWDGDREQLDRAVTAADGRFSLTYTPLDRSTQEDPESPDRWRGIMVIASGAGAGPAWAAPGEVTEDRPIQLVRDDIPIQGKVVDLEGLPIAGATVQVESLWAPKDSGAIDRWLETVGHGPLDGDRPPSHYFPIASKLPGVDLPASSSVVTTDAQGRFRLTGLGRDRLAVLDVRGPTAAFHQVQVVTRKMERVEGRHLDEPGLTAPSYFGANPTIVVEPSRAIEGVIRDAKTKAPIPNATVMANQLAGSLMSLGDAITAVTDSEGRYRLIGLPKGDGHKLAVHPPLDQPYFVTEHLAVSAPDGLGPVKFDIDLRRGLWITGRVTDAKTGEPVQAAIHYFPFLTNKNAEGFANFIPGSLSLHWTGNRHRTDRDGRFRVVGVPGRGLVAAKSFSGLYRLGVGTEGIPEKPGTTVGRPHGLPTYNEVDPNAYQTIALVEPRAESADYVQDLALEPSPSLDVELVDPDGKPLTGAVVWGRFPEGRDFGDHNLYEESRTQIIGLDPHAPRTVVFQHHDRKLGAIVVVKPGEHGDRRITLEPCPVVTGRVLDAEGKPVPGGVTISLARAKGERSPTFSLPGVAFDAEGRFRVDELPPGGTYTLHAEDRLVLSLPRRPDLFKAFEIAQGLNATSGQVLELGTFNTATGKQIKAPENQAAANPQAKPAKVSVLGRIVDLEGRGVAAVTVHVGDASRTKDGDLTPWLEAVRGGAAPWIASRVLDHATSQPAGEQPRAVNTDADGRFRVDGLEAERVVNLTLEGPTIARTSLTIVTRKIDPMPARGFPDAYGPGTGTIYGSEFTFTARPGRPVEGIVRDAKTGAPLPGVEISSYRFAGSDFIGIRNIKVTTDAQGRFRLLGLPKGKGNRLLIVPNDDQPYFMNEFDVPDPEGLTPVAVVVDLHRGIWIEGKVTEKATGKPVADAWISYLPFLSNTYAQSTPEFDSDGNTDGVGFQDRYKSKADGTFRLVGLPGRAIVGVIAHGKPYLKGAGATKIAGMNDRGHFETWRNPVNPGKYWPTSMKEIDPAEETPTVRVDFELVTGASVRIQTVDAKGSPVIGVKVAGRAGRGDHEADTRPAAEFSVENLAPDEERIVMIQHPDRRIGKALTVRAGDDKDRPVVVTLEPLATIVGRVTDADGAPVSGAQIRSDLLPSGDFSLNLGHVTSDRDGRFQVPNVPTGCDYALVIESGATIKDRRVSFARDLKVRPGETTDAGEIRFAKD